MINLDNSELNRLKIKIKENPHSFIAILGAGASMPAGLPSWAEQKEILIKALENQYKDIGEDRFLEIKNLRESKDYWYVFEELKKALGEHRYTKIIRESLDVSHKQIPSIYNKLWNLGISGILTFNLDKFVIDSYSNCFKSSVDFATGKEYFKYKHYLTSFDKFVLFAHGIITDEKSWIWGESEKKDLYRNNEYKNFLCSILNAKNLLILGFNPNEHAFLSLINEIGFDGSIAGYDNYYLGSNLTTLDTKKLNDYGISVIPYAPEDNKHSEISQALDCFIAYKPEDADYSTIYTGKTYALSDIPSYQNCLSIGVDRLREILNGVVAGIIPKGTVPSDVQMTELQNFYNKYVPQLHIAWFVDSRSDEGNKIHGYRIKRNIGRGAFGNVFEAYDINEQKYAIKILLPEVKDKAQYLSCFRRGIRSMNILKEKDIYGMVKIHASYEVPACIVMDYIEGSSLRDAIDKKLVVSPHKKLELIESIATIINKAHQLEERILHRDLKPENIILDGFFYEIENESIDVKVLDFDLSWHIGATELTIALGAMSQGFMAPEQGDDVIHDGMSRNTGVDVFSIGMLAYFILTEKNPAPFQHQFKRYSEDMIDLLTKKYDFQWKCLIDYIGSTIVNATKHSQSERIALDIFINNIRLAKNMIINNTLPNTHPLLLRELAIRIDSEAEIKVTDFGRCIELENSILGKKVVLKLSQWVKQIILDVHIEKTRKEFDNWSSIEKYLENAKDRALSAVDKCIFTIVDSGIGVDEVKIHIAASLNDEIYLKTLKKMAINIQDIRSKLDLRY
jgi:serine/threonine protein kinase